MTHTAAYQALTTHLAKLQYEFVCASPETQARVVRQRCSEVSTEDAKSAEDFFGWSLPCARLDHSPHLVLTPYINNT